MPRRLQQLPSHPFPRAFTLIELLVVIAILALLIAILLPALSRARQRANSVRCLADLKGIGTAMMVYQEYNDGFVVPSYNMTGSGTGGSPVTIDGWPAILDRDGFASGYQGLTHNAFYCPNTVDTPGTANGATTGIVPTGYQDWPITLLTGTDNGGQADPTLPIAGFGDYNGLYQHEIRSSYWINAYNPIGGAVAPTANLYYTQSVGYVFSDGSLATCTKAASFVRPSALIAAADGVYAGQQKKTHLGDPNSRIGYRHPGAASSNDTVANCAFADGHAESLDSNIFPRASDIVVGAYSVLAGQ
jgi:prepilin-type N-terminal cleavage/methylation domain-containing protein/prepilin-type processing-associated H-X9-DG protein